MGSYSELWDGLVEKLYSKGCEGNFLGTFSEGNKVFEECKKYFEPDFLEELPKGVKKTFGEKVAFIDSCHTRDLKLICLPGKDSYDMKYARVHLRLKPREYDSLLDSFGKDHEGITISRVSDRERYNTTVEAQPSDKSKAALKAGMASFFEGLA